MSRNIEFLKEYIKANVCPILIDFLDSKYIPNCILLPSNINIKDLDGHYEKEDYLPPEWYSKLLSENKNVIVIDNIDSINKEEQDKFLELIKYRKISTFDLPNDVVIIITAKKINKDTISKNIYELVAHIEE